MEVVSMPKFGLIMTEGTITEWYKKEGDHVTEGEPLLQVETQKLANDVECPITGTLRRILVAAEETVPCQTPLAELDPD